MNAPPFYEQALLITSGKGGVGKSTLASVLAVALAKLGLKIALIDADITGPSLPITFGIEALSPPASPSGGIKPFYKFGIELLSFGHFIDRGSPISWRGPMLSHNFIRMLSQCQWSPANLLIVDMPPSTSDISLTCCSYLHQLSACIITKSDALSISDSRRAINHFYELGVPLVGIVDNMAMEGALAHENSLSEKVRALPNERERPPPLLAEELAFAMHTPLIATIPYLDKLHHLACSGQIGGYTSYEEMAPIDAFAQSICKKLSLEKSMSFPL